MRSKVCFGVTTLLICFLSVVGVAAAQDEATTTQNKAAAKEAKEGTGSSRYLIGGNGKRLEHQLLSLVSGHRALSEKMEMLNARLDELDRQASQERSAKEIQPIIQRVEQ